MITTVPIVFIVRLNVRTLPFDCDLARRDTVFINKFLGNGSCTFFRKAAYCKNLYLFSYQHSR